MKALSFRQPWATLIVTGEKTIEWRSWKTDYRGDIVVCSSATKQELDWAHMSEDDRACFPLGQAFGIVTLRGIRQFKKSDFDAACMSDGFDTMPDPPGYAWLLENPRFIENFPVKGKLNFFNLNDDLIKVIEVEAETAN
jgi:hypothetical protein